MSGLLTRPTCWRQESYCGMSENKKPFKYGKLIMPIILALVFVGVFFLPSGPLRTSGLMIVPLAVLYLLHRRSVFKRSESTALVCIVCVLLFLVTTGIVGFILDSPWFFILLWILIPIASWIISAERLSDSITDKGLSTARTILIALSIMLSAGLTMSHRDWRDKIGREHVKGYSVSYYDAPDPENRKVVVRADNWLVEHVLNFLFPILIVLSVANIALAWHGITKEIKRRQEEGP